MQGKWKKASATVLAGALMASQMLMQVSAAGGTIDADMSTKTPVIRVVVPTKMEVAVNEFEMGDTGSQVFSNEFTMKNVSEIPVNVEVTSTATLGTGVTLVSTKAAAQDSTDAAMWLAAVAAVNDASGTLEYLAEGTDKTVGALTGSEANATAFATESGASTAVQDFYLAAATAAQYKAIIGTDAEDIGEGADFYKLTATTMADQNAVNAALETQDLYTVLTAPVAGTAQSITKLEKGTTDNTFGSLVYYTMDTEPTAFATVKADSAGIYLYIDTATAATGDAAAFRYAGALSSAKSGWSITDLSAIEIAYDITGVTNSSYDEIKDELVYGYQEKETGPKASGNLNATNLSVTISGLGESATLTKAEVVKTDNTPIQMTQGTHYTYTNGTFTVTKAALVDSNAYTSWKLTFSDNSTVDITIQ